MTEIGKIISELHGRQHAFIYKCARRERNDIEIRRSLRDIVRDASLDMLAQPVELAFGCVTGAETRDEHLFDGRFARPGSLAQDFGPHGHVAHCQPGPAELFGLLTHGDEHVALRFLVFGQEN